MGILGDAEREVEHLFGDYLAPATVTNKTPDLTLIVVDGIADPPTYATVAPGSQSANWSIDAFGAYSGTSPVKVVHMGVWSAWWKIPDGTKCTVVKVSACRPDGVDGVFYQLVACEKLRDPSASTPEDWRCIPTQVQSLLSSAKRP